MPLSNDHRMYYRSSFVGMKQPDGTVLPFYVDEVFCDRNIYDPHEAYIRDGGEIHGDYDEDDHDEFSESPYDVEVPQSYYYCQEAYDSLRFSGRVVRNGSFEATHGSVPISDLVLETPTAGYLKIGESFIYTEYRPIRQAKKGITSERLSYSGNTRFNRVVEALYSEQRDPRIKMNGALVVDTNVMYKGVRIGHLEDGVVVIDVAEASYLSRWIQKELGECRVQV